MTLSWDIGVTTICLTSSAYLYLLQHQRKSSLVSTGLPSTGYILTNQIVHARLLPVESKHAFKYQTMSLLLSLSALENKALNCGWRGVLFGYPGIWGRMTGLRPQTYLMDQADSGISGAASIREKLILLLRPSNITLGEVWMMTMPSFMGFEGINPLTFWRYTIHLVNGTPMFCKSGKVKIKETERVKDTIISGHLPGSFTYLRSTIVRDIMYARLLCRLIPPLMTPGSLDPAIAPCPVIRLHLLTAPPSSQVKLVALLRPTISEPLTGLNLLAALALPPRNPRSSSTPLLSAIPEPSHAPWSALPLGAALLLTSLRIVYQAALLHYQRGLAVFARPEPTAGPGREWVEQALGGVWNDIQPSKKDEVMIGGSIGWQSESLTERWARERFETRMGAAANKLGIRLRIASTNPLVPVVPAWLATN
ncbi:hypothetical protein OPQ81_003892 [Rhizoctonia solani]|nr:hypothetical protein OPQ81_003892 [Rhizoctonia solani]